MKKSNVLVTSCHKNNPNILTEKDLGRNIGDVGNHEVFEQSETE